ncbi:MAG: lipoyl synthase [Pyrinomonadaceae bacterium MAG19_C2-C3]|nr:lipoyl synthase [Pyrinomonadaceae bacterium MAG19_C2-C3]
MNRELPVINIAKDGSIAPAKTLRAREPKPDWLRIRIGDPTNQNHVLKLIEGLNLHTVCQEARCPNIFECWSDKTATFMLAGDTCTRHCGFCAVGKGKPGALDTEEPRHVAEATRHLGLAHVVITSVNRDDLPDGGAAHWAETIREVRALNPHCKIEVLIPDFNGDEAALNVVLDAHPDVLNHNTETIARLYKRVRPDANYEQTMTLIRRTAARRESEKSGMLTKSGIMVGLGETFDEVVALMGDLRRAHCDIMTIGQYLQPYARRLPVERYVTPAEFAEWKRIGMSLGFRHVESSPLTRSSYHAREQAAAPHEQATAVVA